MAVCFICNVKLYGERTRVCSSITPHSNEPYPEKIAELMGDEFVVIVTPADHMCKTCTALLIHMDKLECELKLVKNAMVSFIQKKCGILPADQPVRSINIVNGQIQIDDLEVGQKRVPSGLTFRGGEPSTSTSTNTRRQDDIASTMKIYKCGFCTYQSRDLGHVRFHMRTHLKNKDGEKSNLTATNTVTPQPRQHQQQQPRQQQQQQPRQHQQQPRQLQQQQQPKKRLYKCQVCSTSFDTKVECLNHIQKGHNQAPPPPPPPPATAEEIQPIVAPEMAPITIKAEIIDSADNQLVENSIDVDECQLKEGTSTDMLFNGDGGAAVMVQSRTQNTRESMAGQKVMDDRELLATNVDVSDMAIGGDEAEADHLDLESMLAAIHNDVTDDGGDVQNII